MQNENIQIALIGAGGMGQGDARMSTSLPGVKLVAAADIYDGRLQRAREIWGDGIFTSRDYREVLARKDVDAVIIATPDHWHARITTDALNAGKHVYCEKPMVQKIAEGKPVIEAQKKSGRVLQIGSQYASSVVFQKAAEQLKAGAIGELNMVEAHLDRNTAIGAWQYSLPPDATPQNIDWDRFIGHAPKRPFEPIRLFRWRNYKDYGTGVAGDLYVHLLTGLHVVTGALGPERIYAAGGTRFWKDGRDAPDVMLATMDYPKSAAHPEFTLTLRVNFASGGGEESFGIRFVGSEGIMSVDMDTLTLARTPRGPEFDGTIDTFAKGVRNQLGAEMNKRFSGAVTPQTLTPASETVFRAPRWFSAHREHHRNFVNGVRTGKHFFEDGVFGFRTAGPSLLTGTSMEEGRICRWDPQAMTAS
ncbi:MAG TPA: Gfo/Idh/MocA family oxidoreductase [Bryobacteraceae bacterium]|nr:Gfo/Idh/MocA family oxidoreductase [Bryobacteraceae bacterium]